MPRSYIMRAAVLLAAIFCSGCGTQKEAVKNQYTIASYEASNTTSEYVKRGDLNLSETIFLTLESLEEVEYSFARSGLLIEKVYVLEGDEVTEGTLLAEADNDALKADLKKAEIEKTEIEETISYYTSLLEAEKEKNAKKKEEEIHNLDQISRYELKLQELNDDLIICMEKAGEYQDELLKTQIRAGMDGCVEYVGKYGNGITTDEKIPFIRMGTKDQVFTGSIKGGSGMEQGTEIEITINGIRYDAVVVSVKEEGEETAIGVSLKEYVDLTDVTYAEFSWSEEELKNVLYVPTDAIVTVDGQSYVYVYDESGFPDPVKVTIGKKGLGYTSIESGVSEGDLVERF